MRRVETENNMKVLECDKRINIKWPICLPY